MCVCKRLMRLLCTGGWYRICLCVFEGLATVIYVLKLWPHRGVFGVDVGGTVACNPIMHSTHRYSHRCAGLHVTPRNYYVSWECVFVWFALDARVSFVSHAFNRFIVSYRIEWNIPNVKSSRDWVKVLEHKEKVLLFNAESNIALLVMSYKGKIPRTKAH